MWEVCRAREGTGGGRRYVRIRHARVHACNSCLHGHLLAVSQTLLAPSRAGRIPHASWTLGAPAPTLLYAHAQVGCTLSSLVANPEEEVNDLLERFRSATAAELESGNIMVQLKLRHRFQEPVPVEATVELAGTCSACMGLEPASVPHISLSVTATAMCQECPAQLPSWSVSRYPLLGCCPLVRRAAQRPAAFIALRASLEHTHTHTPAHTYTYTHTRTHTRTQTHTHTHTHAHVCAGTDNQRIMALSCRRTDGQEGNLLVVDTHMRIRFASLGVSALLGYPPRKLAGGGGGGGGGGMQLDALLPPPYNTMHAKFLRVS